jgi:CHAT domain-containing protein/uncharacterized protein HemY
MRLPSSSTGLVLSILLLGSITPLAIQVNVIAQTAQEHQISAKRLYELGRQQQEAKNFQEAKEKYEQALEAYRKAQDLQGEAKTLIRLGEACDKLYKYNEAISYYRQALAIYKKQSNNSTQVASTLVYLGEAHQYLSRDNEAKSYFEQALFIFKKVDRPGFTDRAGMVWVLMKLGNICTKLNEFSEAIKLYEEALNSIQQSNLDFGYIVPSIFTALGKAYLEVSQYPKSIESLEKAIKLFQKDENSHTLAEAVLALGNVYGLLNNSEKANLYYQQSLLISQKTESRKSGERARVAIASRILESQYAEGINLLEKELQLFQEDRDLDGQALVFMALGDAYRRKSQFNESLKCLRKALSAYQKVESRYGAAHALFKIGLVYKALSQSEKEIFYYQQAFALLQELRFKQSVKGVTLAHIGEWLVQQGHLELAISFYKQSINFREVIRNNILALPLYDQEMYIEGITDDYKVLANLLLEQRRIREAQEVLELIRVRETNFYTNREQARRTSAQITFHPLENQAIEIFRNAIVNKRTLGLADIAKLQKTLHQNRDRIIQDGNSSNSKIGNPQNLVANPDALFVQNLVVEGKLWTVWTSQKGGTRAIAQNISREQLTTTVNRFRKQISTRSSDLKDLQATSQRLYNWLIPPELQQELAQNPKRHLIFSLDDVTRYVPVAALYDGQQYLTQRYQLSNAISTETDTRDRLSSNRKETSVLAMGVSKPFPPVFSALDNVPFEVDSIVKEKGGIYPGQAKLDDSFTRQTLQSNLGSYRILHFATHGVFDSSNVINSFLLLGDGNRLPITDIEKFTDLQNTHLVVLSACKTGLGKIEQNGTEISGISSYFLYRGAKSVMASLWAVSDASTSLIMQQFYKHIATGMSKAEALQKVQQDLIQLKLTSKNAPRNNSRNGGEIGFGLGEVGVEQSVGSPKTSSSNYEHPYYWAPFILIGNSL